MQQAQQTASDEPQEGLPKLRAYVDASLGAWEVLQLHQCFLAVHAKGLPHGCARTLIGSWWHRGAGWPVGVQGRSSPGPAWAAQLALCWLVAF